MEIFALKNNEQEDITLKINIFDDLLSKLENQIKQTELNLTNEKESVLLGIECMMEGAEDKIELASLNRQYEKVEKQFDQEIIFMKRKTIKNFISELDKLTKLIRKVYSKELNNK